MDKPDLNQRWIKFVNRKDWKPTSYSGICIKHFENKYIKIGKRARLLYELLPIPTISGNSDDVPLSLQPTPSLPLRKPPKKRSIATTNNEMESFRANDKIKDFTCVSESMCPFGFSFMKCEGYVIFYKLGKNHHNVPEVAESIKVDEQMHVKLFFRGLTVPLPEWFRKRNNIDCKLSSEGMLDNFPSYIQNRISPGLTTIIDELRELQYYKPTGRPKYSAAILRYALYLRYTSRQAYKILQEQFPLPSFSLLRKLHNGGVDPLKAIKLLLNEGSINSDIALLLDEIYIQKEVSYQDGEVVGKDEDGNLYKGVMVFMIVGLRTSIPYVVRAVPEITINGAWLKDLIDETITSLHETGFNVRLVVSDNHSTNVCAFNLLLSQYRSDMHNHYIQHHTKPNLKTYLLFDSVHLLKNIRNNLLNCKRFVFPLFNFDGFPDIVHVESGEVDWHLLYNIYEKDESLEGNLKKAFKLSYNALHPGDNKQSLPLALGIFHASTSAAIRSYYPQREDAASFLNLIDTWWVIVNCKQGGCKFVQSMVILDVINHVKPGNM